MTEEIIIDGVDVAGCNDFYKEWDNWSGKDNYRCQDFLSGMCAGNNCYYKQLKRLEQENKELKARIKHQCYKCRIGDTTEDRLRSALEEINITVKQLLKGVSSNCINNTPYLTALSLIQDKINEVIEK